MQVFNTKDYIPQRVGLQQNPPTIVIEYLIPSQQKIYRHKIKLMRLTNKSNTADFVQYIKKRHNSYVSNSKLLDEQLETLITRLKDKITDQSHRKTTDSKQQSEIGRKYANSKTPNINPFTKTQQQQPNQSSSTSKIRENQFEPIKAHVFEDININSDDDDKNQQEEESENYQDDFESQPESDLENLNLNKLSVEEVQKFKEKMEVKYVKNLLKPGDAGFVYDRQVEFKPKKNSDWDDD
ncbi:unnamed protein product [Paramecium primaurelia]|uniref:Centrosomal protein of 19 kDa n=1 Tax=Paramecium primaurelia TaxID=5886 RepID=A0A8S1PCT7_PARPR|nr:unnamed protein product [Paramecium primaurelia]